jgi:hypothetical protein
LPHSWSSGPSIRHGGGGPGAAGDRVARRRDASRHAERRDIADRNSEKGATRAAHPSPQWGLPRGPPGPDGRSALPGRCTGLWRSRCADRAGGGPLAWAGEGGGSEAVRLGPHQAPRRGGAHVPFEARHPGHRDHMPRRTGHSPGLDACGCLLGARRGTARAGLPRGRRALSHDAQGRGRRPGDPPESARAAPCEGFFTAKYA